MSNPERIFDWARQEEAQLLFRLFSEAGKELRFVGGGVRDRLMRRPVTDLDAATNARPPEIMAILDRARLRHLPTGLAHGTITALFTHRAIEITALRVDTACDGRHAVVAYTDDWQADAARRDFTVNALYLDAAGTVYDYFGGLKDLAEQRIRFIGDPAARIEEDYLRILRFFRFLATHGSPPADAAALAASAAAKEKLAGLSGERIRKEMLTLLGAANPVYALGVMQESGVLEAVLGAKADLRPLPVLRDLEEAAGIAPHPLLRLALLLADKNDRAFMERWRLSNTEKSLLTMLLTHPEVFGPPPYLSLKRAIRAYGALSATLLLARDAASASLAPAAITEPLAMLRAWTPPAFPVNGADLLAQGFAPGKALGDHLKALEARWETSDYTLSREELLMTLPLLP